MSHIVQVHMKRLGGYEEIFTYTCQNLMTHEESVTFLNPLKKKVWHKMCGLNSNYHASYFGFLFLSNKKSSWCLLALEG